MTSSGFDPWVRTHLFAELDGIADPRLPLWKQGRLLAFADSCRHEYGDSLDPLALSTIAVADAAADWLVFGHGDGTEYVAACRFDAELRCAR